MNTFKKIGAIIWGLVTWFMVLIIVFCFLEYFSKFKWEAEYDLIEALKSSISSVKAGIVIVWIDAMCLLYVLKKNECSHCKELFCVEKEDVERLGEEAIHVLVETKSRNSQGEVIGTQEQYVPGTRVRYRTIYVCKKCGGKKYENWSRDYSNT